ncbi:MAG: chorismate mutase [Paludibacteraceae bacterium]|nr:chorismate mutase [Paludibacteraceae bacterium]
MKTNVTTKKPSECTNITEVRNEIDNIDDAIISLLSERFQYVKEVVKYKEKTAASIDAADRKKAVIEQRRLWAEERGLNPDVIEEIYRRLIQYFISEETKIMNL